MVNTFNNGSVLSLAIESHQNKSRNWRRCNWIFRSFLISVFILFFYFWRIGVSTLVVTTNSRDEKVSQSTNMTGFQLNGKNDTPVETSSTYEKRYNCNGDRWGNHQRLHPNQYLCAHRDRYYFGVTENGSLVWIDSKENVTQTWMQGYSGSSFSLQDNGTLVLENRKIGNITSHHAKQKFKNIHWTERCLRKFDCPYLHFHSALC